MTKKTSTPSDHFLNHTGKILHAHQRLMLFYELVLISLGCTVLGWSTPVQFFCLPNKLTNTKPVECCNVQIKQYGLCSLLSRKTIWNTCGNIPKHALTMMIFFFKYCTVGRSIFVNALAILEYEGHLREKYKYWRLSW